MFALENRESNIGGKEWQGQILGVRPFMVSGKRESRGHFAPWKINWSSISLKPKLDNDQMTFSLQMTFLVIFDVVIDSFHESVQLIALF